MVKTMKFVELKPYISRVDRLSICILDENFGYENYTCIADVPDKYDDMYVVGIGRIESEFEEKAVLPHEKESCAIGDGLHMVECIEIMLSEVPVKDTPDRCDFNKLGYVCSRYYKPGGVWKRVMENAKKQIHRKLR